MKYKHRRGNMSRNTFTLIGQKVTCGTCLFLLLLLRKRREPTMLTYTYKEPCHGWVWIMFPFWLLVVPECAKSLLHATIHRWPCDLACIEVAVAGACLPMGHKCSCDLRELSEEACDYILPAFKQNEPSLQATCLERHVIQAVEAQRILWRRRCKHQWDALLISWYGV